MGCRSLPLSLVISLSLFRFFRFSHSLCSPSSSLFLPFFLSTFSFILSFCTLFAAMLRFPFTYTFPVTYTMRMDSVVPCTLDVDIDQLMAGRTLVGITLAFLAVYSAAILVFGKRVSAWCAGKFIPYIMSKIDRQFRTVRAELLRGLHGQDVLDLGCGGGPYFKYVSTAGASSILAIEPNPNLHARIRSEMAKVKVPVKLCPRYIQEVPGRHRFDLAILGNGWWSGPPMHCQTFSVTSSHSGHISDDQCFVKCLIRRKYLNMLIDCSSREAEFTSGSAADNMNLCFHMQPNFIFYFRCSSALFLFFVVPAQMLLLSLSFSVSVVILFFFPDYIVFLTFSLVFPSLGPLPFPFCIPCSLFL